MLGSAQRRVPRSRRVRDLDVRGVGGRVRGRRSLAVAVRGGRDVLARSRVHQGRRLHERRRVRRRTRVHRRSMRDVERTLSPRPRRRQVPCGRRVRRGRVPRRRRVRSERVRGAAGCIEVRHARRLRARRHVRRPARHLRARRGLQRRESLRRRGEMHRSRMRSRRRHEVRLARSVPSRDLSRSIARRSLLPRRASAGLPLIE